ESVIPKAPPSAEAVLSLLPQRHSQQAARRYHCLPQGTTGVVMAVFLRGAVLAMAFVGGTAMVRADTVTVTFVQTNDLSEMSGGANSGGLARLATVIRDARGRGHAYLVHAGNALSPSLLSGLDHGEHMI